MRNFTDLLEELGSILDEAVPGQRHAGKTDKAQFAKNRAKSKGKRSPGDEKRKKRLDKFQKAKSKTPKADKLFKGIQAKEREHLRSGAKGKAVEPDKVTGKGVGDNWVPKDVAKRIMGDFAKTHDAKPHPHPDKKRDGKHYPFKRRDKLGLGPDGKHHYKANAYPWKCICAKGGCKGK